MVRFSLALDALPTWREAAVLGCDLETAASLAELAGVDALRLGISEDLRPVTESDVRTLRRKARCFELRMPAAQGTLKVALESRPDLVVLTGPGWDSPCAAVPIDLRGRDTALVPIVRALEEAHIPVAALIVPEMETVKAAHGLGVAGVEFYTGATVDLPAAERRAGFEVLADSSRLAAKLRMSIAAGSGIGYATFSELLESAPGCERIVVGRAVLARALLVGLDRAIRDFRAMIR